MVEKEYYGIGYPEKQDVYDFKQIKDLKVIKAYHIQRIYNIVSKIEEIIGFQPLGNFPDLKSRLENIEAELEKRFKKEGDSVSGDLEFTDPEKGIIMKARNGSKKFRLYVVDDDGTLAFEEVL